MKKLIYLLIATSVVATSCQKENANNKLSATTEVHYNFYMNDIPSYVSYTSIKDGKTISYNDVMMPAKTAGVYPAYVVKDYVKPGDVVHLELSNTKKSPVGYEVEISYTKQLDNNTVVETPIKRESNATLDNSGKYYIVIDHTFSSEDFK